MDTRAIHRTIARGLSELACEDQFAAAIGREKGWRGTVRNHRVRVWQALSDRNPREFDAAWVLLAQRLFAYHDRPDLCAELVGHMIAAQYEGQREREALGPSREMRTVKPGVSRMSMTA